METAGGGTGMTTNRRYAHRVDAMMDNRILQRIAADGPLQTLSDAELELDMLPLTVTPKPEKVRAWVRFGSTPIQVDAEAMRWTSRAIGIRFYVMGEARRCWVWASAVEPRSERGKTSETDQLAVWTRTSTKGG
jgi:hypothetical protein